MMDASSSSQSSEGKPLAFLRSLSSSSSKFSGSPKTPAQKRLSGLRGAAPSRLHDDADEIKGHHNVLSLMFLFFVVSLFLMWSFDICAIGYAKRVFTQRPVRVYSEASENASAKAVAMEFKLDGAAAEAKKSVKDFFDAAGNFRCPQPARYSREEVAQHVTADDLWVVVDGNVLDVSVFIHQHPGGLVLLDGAGGQDMATAFAGFHHPSTVTLFSSFCIGRIAEEKDRHWV